MANPKFLQIDSKVLINARLPKKLTDKLEKYSELTGNTKTDIFTLALAEYFENITVDNTYLADESGVTIKIPVAPHQKNYCIDKEIDLSTLINAKRLSNDVFFSETFEILNIPNNLDVFNGKTYKTDGISHSYNLADDIVSVDVVHSGIEFFVYADLYKTLIKTDKINVFDMLYCFYFEILENNTLMIKLLDYVTAINYLSNANNDIVKNLLISCYKELDEIHDFEIDRADDIESTFAEENKHYNNPYADPEMWVDENELYADVEKRIHDEYDDLIVKMLNHVADTYNTGNIVKLGTDIDKRMVKPENYIEIYKDIIKSHYDSDNEIYKEVLKEVLENQTKNDEIEKES